MVNDSLRNPSYDNSTSNVYKPYWDHENPFYLQTNDTTLAVQINSLTYRQKYVNRNYRVVFSNWNSETKELVRIPAAYCSEVYADKIESELESGKPGFFATEFARANNREWLCPNTTSFEVLNDLSSENRQYLRMDIH